MCKYYNGIEIDIETVKELASRKKISIAVAEKFFNKKCECGKIIDEIEIAMYLKIFGIYEHYKDDRVYLCKECICDRLKFAKDEYDRLVNTYISEECGLFS